MSSGEIPLSPTKSLESPEPNATPCPRCRQSKSVDSLTGRCTRCQPIQLTELPSDFQAYAHRARFQKYKEFVIGLLIGPVLIAIYFFYASSGKGAPPWILWALLVATLIFIGLSVYALVRKQSLLQRYHRLAYIMQHVKPVDAELQYEVIGGRNSSRRYFKVCQLGPDSKWPDGIGQKIEVDMPPKSEAQAVTHDFWKTLVAGYDPFDKPKLWGKVYFDPDQSGSAVICIQDGLFLSVSENN
jgi:hypothetical protein